MHRTRRSSSVATAAIVAALLLAGCGGDDGSLVGTPAPASTPDVPQGYTAAIKQRFVSGCVDGRHGTRAQCTCLIDYLAKNLPFSAYADATAATRPALDAGNRRCGTKA